MSEAHSDPDLLDLDDVPDTATGMRPAEVAGLIKGVHGLGRWAKRIHKERKDAAVAAEEARREQRALVLWLIGAIAGTTVTMMGTTITAALYVGARVERIEALASRVERLEERQWDGLGPTHTSGGRSAGGE